MTPEQAADVFNTAHPQDGLKVPWCANADHQWSEWDFNHYGDCEYRLCATCGGMEQQWIEPERYGVT